MFEIGVNSWTTIDNADEYFRLSWGGSFWASLILTKKEQLLVTSFRWINSFGYNISPTDTSDVIKNAQCELCCEIYNSFDDYSKRQALYASGVRNFNFDGWSETLVKQELPVRIQNMLSDYKTGDGGKFFEITRDY